MSANVAQPRRTHNDQTRVQKNRFRSQTLRTPKRRAVCAPEDARFCAPGARRSARRERAVLCAVSASLSAPGARRSARRERAAQRAGSAPFCAPEDARAARRETCRGAPCARRVRAACARGAGRSGLSLLARVSQSSAVWPRAGGGTPGVAPRCAGRPPHT